MRSLIAIFLFASLVLLSCKKGERNENQPPETQIVFEEINLNGDERLNSQVRLSWFGTDIDGFVKGYEISLDNENWDFVTVQDSTFLFPLEVGSDTTDIDFYVRSVDNNDDPDPTPAYLKVPLKNAPPEISFVEATLPADSVPLVLTFSFLSTDPDGDNTLTSAYIKLNEGDWTAIPYNLNLLSLVPVNPKATGSTEARLFYNGNFASETVNDLRLNDTNTIYLKVQDLAASESKVDTSDVYYVANQTHDFLYISGQGDPVTSTYLNLLSNFDFDFFDYSLAEKQPKFWEPTFSLILSNYDYLFINADGNTFTNAYNQQNGLLLDFMASSLQSFFNDGGKAFVTTSFNKDDDIEAISEIFPIDSISQSNGQSRILSDSTIYPIQDPTLPSVSPTNLVVGASPMNPAIEGTVIYRAELTRVAGWTGPDVVGVAREVSGVGVTQIFFSVELHDFNKDPVAQQQLIERLLTDELQVP